MKNFLHLLLLLLVITLGCNPDKTTRIISNDAKFNTSDASELFFKNVRQNYYEKNEIEAARLDFYKNKKLLKQNSLLFPQIVHNWMEDEAYILLEFDEKIAEMEQLNLLWQDTSGNYSGENYPLVNKKVHFSIVSDIYNHLLDEHQIYVKIRQDTMPLFPNQAAREAFRITMVDFYRLVDMF